MTGHRHTVTLTKDVPVLTPIPLLNPDFSDLWRPVVGDVDLKAMKVSFPVTEKSSGN